MTQDQNRLVSQQIDEICDSFELALKAGHPMAIENCLDMVAKEHQGRLLRELLEIEISLKKHHVDSQAETKLHVPLQQSYTERFPEHVDIVDAVVRHLTPKKQIGDYEIIKELGHGGMGVVYIARQKLLNQLVAIKVLRQSLLHEPQAVARFRREMQLIGRLDHPNIVRALNAGEDDETQYLVMEFVDGIRCSVLGGWNSESRETPNTEHQTPSPKHRTPLPAVCEIIRQAALGLQHAHEFELVHRDIKPANLMIDRNGTVKILDLGLGKFLSDQRSSEESQLLTKLGATMGTIDYISPEQCECAGNVDIRADIYSLGCTFYYLATGYAPYTDSRYDSTRKKLMAHIVGDIPSLKANVPEVSDELERVFNKMLAKDPVDRFQTPIEVAEAIEPFADFDALLEIVDAFQGDHPSTMSRSGRIITRGTTRSRPVPKPARNMMLTVVWMVLFPLVAGLCTALALSVVPWFRTAPTDIVPESITEAQLHLAQLPGLNGGWWFDEIPWYLPPVRELIQRKLAETTDPKTVLDAEPEQIFDPNVAGVYAWLWNVVSKYSDDLTPTQKDLVNKLKLLADSGLNNSEWEKQIGETLALWVAAHPAEQPWSAVDQHSRALLEHRLALLQTDKKLATTATESYHRAADLYRREIDAAEESTTDSLRRLKTLCLADAVRLTHISDGTSKSNDEFEAVYARGDSGEQFSALFNIELRATQGALRAESGHYDDSRFIRALNTVTRSPIGDRLHPLTAYIHERYAWSLIDQWKIKEAEAQFRKALLIRASNRNESKNPFARTYIFHNLHGLAMTYRYCGNTSLAVDEYRKTLVLIEEERENFRPSSDLGRQYLENLRERAANTRECLADCTLYGGAASGIGQGQLVEAAKLYAEAAELYDAAAPKQVMRTKQAIVLFLLDDLDEGKAILDALDKEKHTLLGNQKRTEMIRQLADAMLAFRNYHRQGKVEEGKQALRQLLTKMDFVNFGAEETRRENFEMRLFAAEFLLACELDRDEIATAGRDMVFLNSSFVVFWNKPETRPFIRRPVELTLRIEALAFEKDQDQRHLDQMVKTLQRMRFQGHPDAERIGVLPTLVVFFLTDEPDDGWAVFFPQDGRHGELYRAPLTRQQVKSASQRNTHNIVLDEHLRKAIDKEKQAGRSIVVSWSDAASWARPDDALSNVDWPFGDIVPESVK